MRTITVGGGWQVALDTIAKVLSEQRLATTETILQEAYSWDPQEAVDEEVVVGGTIEPITFVVDMAGEDVEDVFVFPQEVEHFSSIEGLKPVVWSRVESSAAGQRVLRLVVARVLAEGVDLD